MILQKYKQSIINDAIKSTRIAVDTETVSLVDKTLIGFSFAYTKANKIVSWYVPVRHNKFNNMPLEDVQKILKVILNHGQLIFHNYVFDGMVFKKFGIPVKAAVVHDTMILAHLIDENSNQGLKPCALRYCHHKMKHFKEICGSGKNRISFADIKKEVAVNYGSEDAEYTCKLFKILYPKVIADDNLYRIYETIERPLLLVVEDMQINGITIDNKQVDRIREKCQKQVSDALERIEYLMPNINLNSPKQLREHFIDKKRLTSLKLSKKTQLGSVDKEFLEHYETDKRCPEIKFLLAYRKYNKILSTFIPALTTGVNAGYKIHAQFRQSGTTSGRFSSSNPNMQNIPRTDDEFDIRAAIIADEGDVLIGADYSQIELRIAAHFSQEPSMLSAYRENGDIHQQTADACGSTRQEAKTINFGMLYGMYYKTLAKQLEVSEQKAIEYFNQFWDNYNTLKDYMEKAKKDAMKNGYTMTFFGRKRHMTDEFTEKEEFKKGAELRSMVNAIIQGTGADIIKLAMLDVYQPLKDIGGRLVLCVHDEILCSVPKNKEKEAIKIITKAMLKHSNDFRVPLAIDLKTGNSWSECHG
jgi:DNA polymerase-1